MEHLIHRGRPLCGFDYFDGLAERGRGTEAGYAVHRCQDCAELADLLEAAERAEYEDWIDTFEE